LRHPGTHARFSFRSYEPAIADHSAIEWTDATWNPVTGCTKITAGCDNCYAARFSERFRGVPGHPFETGFDLTLRPHRLAQPRAWRRPRRIFVNWMSDLFHKDIPRPFIDQVRHHGGSRLAHLPNPHQTQPAPAGLPATPQSPHRPPPNHIWLGVSVEDSRALARIDHLRAAPAAVRFLSIEPLIAPVGPLNLQNIHWVIVGGESGPHARPMHRDWVREIRDECTRQNVPFFFKQWGVRRPKSGGRDLDGREWNEPPVDLASRPLAAE
jgi:protein gp37